MMTLEQLVRELNSTVDDAVKLDAVDEVAQFMRGECRWFSGRDSQGTISIDVARDSDVKVESMNLFLSSRRYDQANPNNTPTDITFRPSAWVSTCNSLPVQGALDAVCRVQDANATFMLSDTHNGTYQGDVGLVVAAAYSTRYGQDSAICEQMTTAWVGKRRFCIPLRLKRGSTLSCVIQPTFGRAQQTTILTEFRATLVLHAKRIVRGPA